MAHTFPRSCVRACVRTCVACLLVLLPAQAAAAAPKQKPAQELAFTDPPGWDRTEQDRIVVFTPPNMPPSKCVLIVTPGENLEGDFVKWFKTKWDALRKQAKVVQGGERTGQDGPNGSSVLYQAALVEAPGPSGAAKKRSGVLLYAVNIGSAVHWVVFRTDGPELFNQYKKTVNQFLAGMKFVESVPAAAAEKEQAKPRNEAPKAPPRKRLPAAD